MLFKKYSFKYFFSLLLGTAIGFSPLIIFDLKHDFYNLNTVLLILKSYPLNQEKFSFSYYRFLSLMPFVFLISALFLKNLFKKKRLLATVVVILYSCSSLFLVFKNPYSGYTMPKGWNYLGLKKAFKIILKENLINYNIASLLSGDTRDYPLRFLLTSAKKPPLTVEKYPNADYLFVTSQYNKEKTINNSVWEIASFCPCRLVKTWPIQNNINLYLLQKSAILQ